MLPLSCSFNHCKTVTQTAQPSSIQVSRQESFTEVTLAGSFSLAVLGELLTTLQTAIAAGAVKVDASAVTRLDTSAAWALLEAAKTARDARPDQATAEAATPPLSLEVEPQHAELVEKLRQAVQNNPNDQTGLRLLVDNEARLGNLTAARAAQQQLMGVLGDQATPDDYTDLGEIMILAAGGYVSPQAEQALVHALNGNPQNPRARYYSGLSLAQTGRPDVAFRMWDGLLQEGPPDAPWIPLIQSQIGAVARAAGIVLPDPSIPGPSAQDIENADAMTADERNEMIGGMVSGLAERLATEGGTAAEWARLIRAYGVLGETAKADAIWQEAKTTFASNPEAMILLRTAAQDAEVLQ